MPLPEIRPDPVEKLPIRPLPAENPGEGRLAAEGEGAVDAGGRAVAGAGAATGGGVPVALGIGGSFGSGLVTADSSLSSSSQDEIASSEASIICFLLLSWNRSLHAGQRAHRPAASTGTRSVTWHLGQ